MSSDTRILHEDKYEPLRVREKLAKPRNVNHEKLIKCLNPKEKTGRLYKLTKKRIQYS